MLDKNKKLLGVQNKALDWIYENLSMYKIPPKKTDFYSVPDLAELSLLFTIYKRSFNMIRDYRIEEFISVTFKTLTSINYIDQIRRKTAYISDYAHIFASLHECGIELENFKSTLQTVIDQRVCLERENFQFKTMDLYYSFSKGGLRHSLPTLQSIYHRTLLSKIPQVLFLDLYDVYCITHVIFYLSDMGIKGITEIPLNQVLKVRWTISSLIGIYLREKNWDILAELLLCCHCLRWHPNPLYEIALENLLNAQRNDGSIPGPSFNLDESESMEDDESRKYNFSKNRHTTLVTTILCLLENKENTLIGSQNIYGLRGLTQLLTITGKGHMILLILVDWELLADAVEEHQRPDGQPILDNVIVSIDFYEI
jgi:hypothetical protein